MKLQDLSLSTDPRIDTAIKFEFDHECEFEHGHANDYDFVRTENVPGDAGGQTKYGIDKASHPNVDIENLEADGAAAIYTQVYWNQNHCSDTASGWGEIIFDIAINNGRGTASRMCTRALGIDLPADGGLFPQELSDATHDAPRSQLGDLLDLREQHYRDIAAAKRSQRQFLDGWINRNNDLRRFVAGLVV